MLYVQKNLIDTSYPWPGVKFSRVLQTREIILLFLMQDWICQHAMCIVLLRRSIKDYNIIIYNNKNKKLDINENCFPLFSITTRPKLMIFCTKSISFRFRRPWCNVGIGTINTADLKSTKSVSSPSLKIKIYVVIFP